MKRIGLIGISIFLLIAILFFYIGYFKAVGHTVINYGDADLSEQHTINNLVRRLKIDFYVHNMGQLYEISYISRKSDNYDYKHLAEEYDQVMGFYISFHTCSEEECWLPEGYGSLEYDFTYDLGYRYSWWFVKDTFGIWKYYSCGFC